MSVRHSNKKRKNVARSRVSRLLQTVSWYISRDKYRDTSMHRWIVTTLLNTHQCSNVMERISKERDNCDCLYLIDSRVPLWVHLSDDDYAVPLEELHNGDHDRSDAWVRNLRTGKGRIHVFEAEGGPGASVADHWNTPTWTQKGPSVAHHVTRRTWNTDNAWWRTTVPILTPQRKHLYLNRHSCLCYVLLSLFIICFIYI